MINAMLIDDDAMIRDYLRDVIQWDRLHLNLCCEAGDSESARELYQLHHPKIIITDINIPIISGLELAKEFIVQDKDVHIILITGYGDFENVRESVSIGAIDLLSKPIDPAEINESLQKAVRRFTLLQRQYHTESALSSLLSENRELLQNRCVAQILSHAPAGGERRIRKQFELLSLSFTGRYFATVIIEFEDNLSADQDGAAFPAALKKLCQSAFQSQGFRIFCLFPLENRMDCLVNWSFDLGNEQIEATLSRLTDEVQFYLQSRFCAYIGGTVEQLSQVYLSTQQALASKQFLDDSFQGVINYRNVEQYAVPRALHHPWPKEQLVELAQTFCKQEFQALLRDSCRRSNADQLRDFSLELLSQLAGLCTQAGIYPWNTVNYPDTVARLFAASSVEEIESHLSSACSRLIDLLLEQRTQSKNQLIRSAKSFIQENLRDPELSLESISSHIGLSKIYFCQLFHKEEGVSFTAYLNAKRIEKACSLLRSTNKKIFEISDETGYRNPKYFNYVFKRVTGVTPMDYRKGAEPTIK